MSLSSLPNILGGGHPVPVPATQGGTGQISYAVGDLLYANTTSTLARLAEGTAGFFLQAGGAGVAPLWAAASGAGLGDFSGPASSTANAVVRFSGTGGKNGLNSGVTIDNTGNVVGPADLTLTGSGGHTLSLTSVTSGSSTVALTAAGGGSNAFTGTGGEVDLASTDANDVVIKRNNTEGIRLGSGLLTTLAGNLTVTKSLIAGDASGTSSHVLKGGDGGTGSTILAVTDFSNVQMFGIGGTGVSIFSNATEAASDGSTYSLRTNGGFYAAKSIALGGNLSLVATKTITADGVFSNVGRDLQLGTGAFGAAITVPNNTGNVGVAGNLTVSGAGGIAVAGSAALSGYSNVNSGGLSSTTALNPGILVFGGGAGTSQYGMDLGYNGNYRTRIFSPGDVVISNVNAIPTGQSSFTDIFTFSTITGTFTASGAVIGSAGISIVTAGATLSVKSGANAASGTVTLVAGTATITSTAIDANTFIGFSEKTAGGTPGVYQPLAAVSAGSAVVTSAATDTSTYNWVAFKVG